MTDDKETPGDADERERVGAAKRQQRSRNQRKTKVADASPRPSRQDESYRRAGGLLRTVPEGTAHYSCSGLIMDSPKSSEGSARLYSRGWANGDANAGRRKFRDWEMLVLGGSRRVWDDL